MYSRVYTTVHYVATDGPGGRQTRGVLRIVEVDSADDPRLADYTRLTDAGLRTHLEAERGLFIAEGTKVITRAVAAGYPVRSMLLGRSRLIDLASLGEAEAPVYVVPDEVAERLTGYRVHRGALAALARRPLPEVAGLVAGARRIVVLEDLVDHANVGAIFRCAAALGVDAVVLSPRCAGPALPAVGQSLDGRGVRDPVRPDERLVRRPGRPEVGRLPRPRAHPRRRRHPDRRWP